MQTAIRDAFDPVIAPAEAKLKKPKRVPEAPDELLATLAALERVPVARRVQLGEWIHEKTWGSDDPRLWGAIGRVGARVPVYASVHHVVSAKTAEVWLDRLLKLKWESVATAPHAAVQLARVTGDRARDVSEKLRAEVAKKLVAVGAKEAWVRAFASWSTSAKRSVSRSSRGPPDRPPPEGLTWSAGASRVSRRRASRRPGRRAGVPRHPSNCRGHMVTAHQVAPLPSASGPFPKFAS